MANSDAGSFRVNNDCLLKIMLTAAIAIVIVVRCPELFAHPRFWAEEGNFYFASAYNNSFPAHLFSSHLGYYTLYNNLAAFLATLVPLESAPTITTWLSFLVQLGVSSLALWGTYRMLPHLAQKFVLAVSIQLLAYSGSWLNIASSQYFFTVITFLILMHDEEAVFANETLLHGVLLFIAGLTGVLSCFLLPAFIYKYFRTRLRQIAVYAGILSVTLSVQAAIFLQSLLRHDPELGARFAGNEPGRLLVKTVSFQFAAPFFGHLVLTTPTMEDLGYELRKLIFELTGFDKFWSESQVITFIVGLIMLVLLATLFYRMRSDRETEYLLLVLVFFIPLSIVLSVKMSGGPTYTYFPSVVFVFFIAGIAGNRSMRGAIRGSSMILIGLSLLSSGYEYRRSIYETAYSRNWLPWKDEVRKWRQYQAYDPAIWPPPWRMQLKK